MRKRAEERSVHDLAANETIVLDGALLAALSPSRQHSILDRDLDVVGTLAKPDKLLGREMPDAGCR